MYNLWLQYGRRNYCGFRFNGQWSTQSHVKSHFLVYYNIFFLELSVTVARKEIKEGTATEHGAFVFDLQRQTTSRSTESLREEATKREVKESTTVTCTFVTVKFCYKYKNVYIFTSVYGNGQYKYYRKNYKLTRRFPTPARFAPPLLNSARGLIVLQHHNGTEKIALKRASSWKW